MLGICAPSLLAQEVKSLNPTSRELSQPVAPIKPVIDRPIYRDPTGEAMVPKWRLMPRNQQGAAAGVSTTLIGQTTYDLQSNAAIGRRVENHLNGEVSAVWTVSAEETNDAFPDRGTGYNFLSDTGWAFGVVNSRVEGTRFRTGWPSIGNTPDGEYTIAHSPNRLDPVNPDVLGEERGGFILSRNGGLGRQNWNPGNYFESSERFPESNGPIWYRTDNSGGFIYLIGTYNDTGLVANGIRRPTVYFRYNVAEDSFYRSEAFLENYNDGRTTSGEPDAYSLDARDSVVAIVMAQSLGDIILWRSEDYGQTFEKTIIDTFPRPEVLDQGNFQDLTFGLHLGNDENVNVLLDQNHRTHVSWGFRAVQNTDQSDNSFQVITNLSGIGYWNDYAIDSQTVIVDTIIDTIIVGGVGQLDTQFVEAERPVFADKSLAVDTTFPDLNDNNVLDMGDNTYFVDDIANGGARYTTSFYTSFPQMGVDSNNNLFLTFSMVVEGDDRVGEQNFRDIFITYSRDSGRSWSMPVNLTNTPLTEEVYNSVATEVDSLVHLIYQSDGEPGTNLTNDDPIVVNDIFYTSVNVQALFRGEITSVQAHPQAAPASEVRLFPNPMDQQTTLQLRAQSGGEGALQLLDMAGRTVYQERVSAQPGINRWRIGRGELQPGVYIVRLDLPEAKVTRRLSVR